MVSLSIGWLVNMQVMDASGRILQAEGSGAGVLLALIADSTLGAPAASFDVQNIPATYAHLKMVGSVRPVNAGLMFPTLRANNDSGANYLEMAIEFNAGATHNGYLVNSMTSFWGNGTLRHYGGGTALYFSPIEIDLFNYANTTNYKNAKIMTTYLDYAIANYHDLGWSVWKNAAAINRVTYFYLTGNILAASRLTMYGLGVG